MPRSVGELVGGRRGLVVEVVAEQHERRDAAEGEDGDVLHKAARE